jgi:hypothetical protein
MENSSGQGQGAIVPAEINKWNWGAFLLNWIWGIGNNTYIAFLMFVPLVNLVMAFVLGAKGSAWAWRNKKWESIEQFQAVQSKWTKWALLIYALFVAMFIGIFFVATASMKDSDAYKMAVTKLVANEEATQLLGKPITTGAPTGSFDVSGPDGKANFAFSAEGPSAKGTVYLDAVKVMGEWKINRLELAQEGTSVRIDLDE